MFVFINIGPIGLVSLLAAKAMGASQVIISGNVYVCVCIYIYKREFYMYKLHIKSIFFICICRFVF